MKYFIIILSLLLVLVSGTYVCSEVCCIRCSHEEIIIEPIFASLSATNFTEKLDQDVVLIDIRTPEEFLNGHIEGAININFYEDFSENIDKLDKEKKYLIYCNSGRRTGLALKQFEEQGFNEVYDLKNGISSLIN